MAMASDSAPQPTSPDTCDVRVVHPDKVAAARDLVPSPATAARLADQFKLLSDPGRVRMIYALLEAGELCVCDLAAVIGATESATSHQLRQLRSARLVTFRKEGRVAYYRIDDAHIRLLLDVAAQHYLHVDGTRH